MGWNALTCFAVKLCKPFIQSIFWSSRKDKLVIVINIILTVELKIQKIFPAHRYSTLSLKLNISVIFGLATQFSAFLHFSFFLYQFSPACRTRQLGGGAVVSICSCQGDLCNLLMSSSTTRSPSSVVLIPLLTLLWLWKNKLNYQTFVLQKIVLPLSLFPCVSRSWYPLDSEIVLK